MNEPRKIEPLNAEQTALYRARQRGRNRVLGAVLCALAVLFFAITIVKISGRSGGAL